MKWASCISLQESVPAALEEAAEGICNAFTNGSPDISFVFYSPRLEGDASQIPSLLKRYFEPGMLIGCSAEGVIGGGLEIERRAALSLTCAKLPGVNLIPTYTDAMARSFHMGS
jgi:small ligand-binding sensory domain FIST